MAERDKGLKVLGSRQRTLVTSVGEITISRRLYRDKAGRHIFLLDQALGLEPRRRPSKRMEQLALDLATEMPFRRAAGVSWHIVPSVSPMTVWSAVKEAGEQAHKEADELRRNVFERGKVPEGGKSISNLNIEADEVYVKRQRGQGKGLGIKMVVGYEGKKGLKKRL